MYAPIRSAVAIACRAGRSSLSGASVLCYHSIGDNAARSTISPDVFDAQMSYLARTRDVVPPSELVRRRIAVESVSGCVAITFDDGYRDNLTFALPILEKYKLPAAVFVITSRIGKTNTYSGGVEIPLMDETELREAQGRGLEILSHTATHQDVRELDPEAYVHEFEDSRQVLSDILGVEVPRIVAYPKGRSDERVRAWLDTHGWCAFGTRGGTIRTTSPRLDMERNGIRRDTSMSEFRTMVSDGADRYQRVRALAL